MKLSLVVLSQGKGEGKVIPVTLSQFLIGRDPQCHLRPASAVISKRHCAVLVRGSKAFVRDFDSTNGTFINDEAVKGERELHNNDSLKVGPIQFRVVLEVPPPVNKPTPVPTPASADANDDESVAAMLLSLQDEAGGSSASSEVKSEDIPAGSTVMEIMAPQLTPQEEKEKKAKEEKEKATGPKAASGNTSSAAKAILEKYTRRQRS